MSKIIEPIKSKLIHPIRRYIHRRWLLTRNPIITYDHFLMLLFAIGITVVCFQLFGLMFPSPVPAAEAAEASVQSVPEDPKIVELLTFLFTAYMTRQILVDRKTADMDISNTIYAENTTKRSNEAIQDAVDAINSAMEKCHSESDRVQLVESYRSSEDFDNLKELVFHYEYLGYLVYYQKIDFHLLFDTISFPDAIMEAALKDYDGISFLALLREERPDNWVGLEYLYHCYLLLRARDEEWRNADTHRYCLESEIEAWEMCWNRIPK